MSDRKVMLRQEHRRVEFCGHWRLSWWVRGEHGALEVQATDYGKDRDQKYFRDQFTGGVETHSAKPPEYMAGDAPSHDCCRCIGDQPCWHDGSSLAFDHFRDDVKHDDHETIFNALRHWYLDRFHGAGEEDEREDS